MGNDVSSIRRVARVAREGFCRYVVRYDPGEFTMTETVNARFFLRRTAQMVADALHGAYCDGRQDERLARTMRAAGGEHSAAEGAAVKRQRDDARAELARLRASMAAENDRICQILGAVLGYPRFCDDQRNFPSATEADGVCVGDHVAMSLASEAARELKRLKDVLHVPG